MLGVIDIDELELVDTLDSGTDTNSTYFHPTANLAVVTNDGADSHVSILQFYEVIGWIEVFNFLVKVGKFPRFNAEIH